MSGLYIKLDVEYSSDDEFIEAGPMAELLYLRALCFIKRKNLDGFLTDSQVILAGSGIPSPKKRAQTLCDVGLFTAVDGGYHVPAFLKRNMSRKEIEASKDLAREAGERGAHERWHVSDNKPNAKCRFCIADRVNGVAIGVPHRGANGVAYLEEEPKEEPEPEPEPKEEPEPIHLPTGSTGSDLTPAEKKKCNDVLEHIITRRIDGKPVGAKYRETVHADVKSNYAKPIARLVPMFPDAPIDMIAHGAETGDTRNLAHYAQPEPEPEPDEPKLTAEQIQETINAAKGAA